VETPDATDSEHELKLLIEQLEPVFAGSKESRPVHWSDLCKRFVEGGICSNATLVAAVNAHLLPAGNVRGSNHNFWIDPSTKPKAA
jgi:hypothetical protein